MHYLRFAYFTLYFTLRYYSCSLPAVLLLAVRCIYFACSSVSLRGEGFFCSLDVLYGGLGIGKLQFFIKKLFNCFFSCKLLVIKTLDLDWIPTRISVQPKMLDLDPDQMNTVRIRTLALSI